MSRHAESQKPKAKKFSAWVRTHREKIFDAVFLGVVVILYAILALVNLGDDVAPQTFWQADTYNSFKIVLPETKNVSNIMFYTGETGADFEITYQLKETEQGEPGAERTRSMDGAFKWLAVPIYRDTLEVTVTTPGQGISYGEIGVFDGDMNLIPGVKVIRAAQDDYGNTEIPELTDEQDTVVSRSTFMNTSYFDEVYFAQTAYEYAHELNGYETVHPPLGKIIQSIPIVLTGRMTPFTWRIGGTICGIIIVIVTYFLAKQIFKKPGYARTAAILMALSGLHFTQTRIGTIDSYLCLFTMLSFLFMFKFYDNGKFRNFLLSGIFFGCAFATKWSGAFGGIGLAIIFFKYIHKMDKKAVLRWVLKGVLCFILVPLFIYCSSYLLFPKTTNAHDLSDVFNQSRSLFLYHSQEKTPHPYSSKWYTWPISLKPMLYYLDLPNGKHIYLVANYAIAFVSVVALLVSAYFGIKKKDRASTLIVLAWLSLWLPYAFISRTMFLYHYLPASVFAILAIPNMFMQIPRIRKLIPYYLIIVLAAFIACYPKMVGI